MSIFQPKSCSDKGCTLCNLYIRIGLLCLGVLWLWGNIALLAAWSQGTPLPSNAATQAAILGDIALPIMACIRIIKNRKK